MFRGCRVIMLSCQNNVVSRRHPVKAVSCQTASCENDVVSKSGVVTTLCRSKPAPYQGGAVPKTYSCQNNTVPMRCGVNKKKRYLFREMASCQHDVVSTRHRINAVSCQTNSCHHGVVSRRRRVNTSPCEHDNVSRRRRAKATACHNDVVPT